MIDAGDSLVAPPKSSPVKAIVAVIGVGVVATAGWWMFGRGKGQAEDPARVLIVGPTPELAGFLEREGFDPTHLSVGDAIGEGQAFDSSLDELAAMVEYADQSGIGFVALNMAHGQTYDFASAGYEAEPAPPGTTFAVLSIGDLGKAVRYGGVVPEVHHEQPAGEQTGLLLALFGHEQLAKARDNEANNDLMIRFGSAGTVDDVADYEKAQDNMRRQIEAWRGLAAKEQGDPPPVDLARPYEPLRGWPLANGELLLAAGRDAWRTSTGRSSEWRGDELEAALSVVTPEALDDRQACAELPDTLSFDGGFAVSPRGDALLIPSDRWVADLWVLDGPGCAFVKRDQIRRLDDGELGHPRASGRTAASQRGRLAWADAKMRAYRSLRLPGVSTREGELHWVSDEVVVMPASLDFVAAARHRAEAMSAADLATPEIDEDELPPSVEGLVFVRLPAPREQDEVLAVVAPVDMLVPAPGEDSGQMAIRAVFPLASEGETLELMALVDRPEGSQLVRVELAREGEAWANVVAPAYDLAAAAGGAPVEILASALVTDDLPHQAHELAISPDGALAAWAAPVGEAPAERPLANFEIFTLDLTTKGAKPVQVTQNQRADQRPRFVGAGEAAALVFDTSYAAVEKLPSVDALRVLPLAN